MNAARVLFSPRVHPQVRKQAGRKADGETIMHTHVHSHGSGSPHTHPHPHKPGAMDDHNHPHSS